MSLTNNLANSVTQSLEYYFEQLDGESPKHVYDLVIREVEKPLLQAVLKQTNDNQSKAAEMLGLNRGTLRKKLKQYNLLQS